MGAFGDKFRTERERRGFTLDDVSNVTKIGSRMLKAIEEEHFDRLPGGVFNKGFIRTYARHLGLNDEEAIADYLAAMQEARINAQKSLNQLPGAPGTEAAGTESRVMPVGVMQADVTQTGVTQAGVTQAAVTHAGRRRVKSSEEANGEAEELPEMHLPKAEHIRPRRPRASGEPSLSRIFLALIVAVVLVGIAVWSRHSRNAPAPASTASSLQPPMTSFPAAPPPSTTAVAGAAAANPQLPSPSATHPAVPAAELEPVGENDVTTRNLKPSNSVTRPPQPAPTLTLIIRAAEDSWISVTADGQPVTQETLIAPAHTSVRASREIVVKAGNAAGVSFVLNGKAFSAQADESEVKTFIFDNTGMRTADPAR